MKRCTFASGNALPPCIRKKWGRNREAAGHGGKVPPHGIVVYRIGKTQRADRASNGSTLCAEDGRRNLALSSCRYPEAVFCCRGMVRRIPCTKRRASHDEETCAPASGLCGGRLSGYGPYGRNMEPARMERAAVGGGRAGRRHRIDRFAGVEPMEGEEGCPHEMRGWPDRQCISGDCVPFFRTTLLPPSGMPRAIGWLPRLQPEVGGRFSLHGRFHGSGEPSGGAR